MSATTQIQRLNWKCGKTRPIGWINAGENDETGVDIGCDIVVDGLPLEDCSIDYISSRYSLQELDIYSALIALRELWRVLKPGGFIRLCLFDFDRAIDVYRSGRQDSLWYDEWETFSGNFITQLLNFNHVKTPLNTQFTQELLEKAGYDTVRRTAYRHTTSAQPEIVELDVRGEESLFIEARKPLDAPTNVVAPKTPSQIHLSWSEDPSSSFTVVWRARKSDKKPFIELREVGSRSWQRVSGDQVPGLGRSVPLQRATIQGLKAATEYEYRISGSELFRARTAPSPGPADFCFGFICDTGLIDRPDGRASGTKQIIDELSAARPLFVLGGGDYAYADRDGRFDDVKDAVDAWFVQMQPLIARSPLMAQFGNHEVFLGERFRDWAPRFAHPKGDGQGKNYSFNVGDVHFAALFVVGPSLDANQLLWLDRDLASARADGARWLIVYQHEPIFGHGRSHPASPQVRRLLTPILERHRVDLHLSGHDQNYERTYPLSSAWPDPTPPTTPLHDYYSAGEGVIYVKISPSGKRSDIGNDFSRFATDQQPFIAARDDTCHHFAIVTVRATAELVIEVFGVGEDGSSKTVVDSFRIVAAPAENSNLSSSSKYFDQSSSHLNI